MDIIKTIHVLSVFVWVGNLLALTRMLGYHFKESKETQQSLIKWYKKMYYYVGLPSMIVSICLGLVLISKVNFAYNPAWFHIKLTVVMCLIMCDLMLGKKIRNLENQTIVSKGRFFTVLHGCVGLSLILTLTSLYIIRDPIGEWMGAQKNSTLEQLTQEK